MTFEDIAVWCEVAWRFGRREALKYPPLRRFPAEMMHPAGLVLPHLSGTQDARDLMLFEAARTSRAFTGIDYAPMRARLNGHWIALGGRRHNPT